MREEEKEEAREEAEEGAREDAREEAGEETGEGAGEEAGEEAKEGLAETRSPTSIVRLTGRDKELLAHVAAARYLTLPQLKRIVFVRSLSGKEGTGARSKRGRRTSSADDG